MLAPFWLDSEVRLSNNRLMVGHQNPSPTVLFDGDCNLCNAMVRFIRAHDPAGRIHFAPSQSPEGRALLPPHLRPSPSTVVLIENGRPYTRSTAALRIASHLGWPWRALSLLRIIPPAVRDPIYDWIAQHRYQWFGFSDSCPIQSAAR